MDIVFSASLIIFSIYSFILVGIESPAPTATELGAAFWPRIIIAFMLMLLTINMVKQLKERKTKKMQEKFDFPGFFKSKLFIGMALVSAMATAMPYVGFISVCFVFLVAYAALLGEKNIVKSMLISLVITLFLYIVFQGALDIRLERGIGIFRNLALYLEGILLSIRRGL